MSIEILKIIEKKDKYEKYKKFIEDHYLSVEEIKTIVKDIDKWYTEKGKEEIDWNSFTAWFKTIHSSFKKEKLDSYEQIFNKVSELKEDDSITIEILHSFILKDIAAKIEFEAIKAQEGKIDNLDTIYDYINNYIKETDELQGEDKSIVHETIMDIAKEIYTAGYDWRWECLNRSLGPLRPGDFVVFATRPDGGKTSCLCNQATFIANQLSEDQSILWFNNEGESKKIKWRLAQVATGKTSEQINADPVTAHNDYIKSIGGKDKIFVFKGDVSMNTSFIETRCKQYNPGLIILDQLYKVHGFEKQASLEVQRQGLLFQWAREVASKYNCPVLTVHQLDASAEGMQYVPYDKLYGSKTAVQGEADAIVTMGWIRDPSIENKRYLFVPKNKLMGGPKSIPTEKKGMYELEIIPETGRFIE